MGRRPTRGTQSGDDVEYRVELDVYNGPLDLLLYLIKRDELDIYDIPITRILDSYMRYVETCCADLREEAGLDINVAGDFLVMAATLMEIKSAMLLPRQPEQAKDGQSSAAQDLADPRYELVQQLLEYKRFKDTATVLERRHQEHAEPLPALPRHARTSTPTSRRRWTWTRCRSGTCCRRSAG